MYLFFAYLFLIIFAGFSSGMEQPAKPQFPVQKPLATSEIYTQALDAVRVDYLKRLETFLQNYTFTDEQMACMLGWAMGKKEYGYEFMGCFTLLLQHGAPVDMLTSTKHLLIPLHQACIDHHAYIKPLLMYGATPNPELKQKIELSPEMKKAYEAASKERWGEKGNVVQSFLDSQVVGKSSAICARKRFIKTARAQCNDLRAAVRHEDIDSLSHLLSNWNGTAQEKEAQLSPAVVSAIALDNLEAIDELAKHGLSLLQKKLDFEWFYHPNLMVHCARNKYIACDHLDEYERQIPRSKSIASSMESTAQFNAKIEKAKIAIIDARKLLESGDKGK